MGIYRAKMKPPPEDPLDRLLCEIIGLQPMMIRINAMYDPNSDRKSLAAISRNAASRALGRHLVVLIESQSKSQKLERAVNALERGFAAATPHRRLTALERAAHRLLKNGKLTAKMTSQEQEMCSWEVTVSKPRRPGSHQSC